MEATNSLAEANGESLTMTTKKEENQSKGYDGWINETTSYRKGGSAGSYNIFENDKYRGTVGVEDFKRMLSAKSRMKKDWKNVELDSDTTVWPKGHRFGS